MRVRHRAAGASRCTQAVARMSTPDAAPRLATRRYSAAARPCVTRHHPNAELLSSRAIMVLFTTIRDKRSTQREVCINCRSLSFRKIDRLDF